MPRKLLFGSLWLGFISYAFFIAPPDRPETFDLIQRLSAGDWDSVIPLIVALFNLMGVWPLVYCGVLFADGRGQKISAWPFAVGTFGLGAFFLLPYLTFRQPNPGFRSGKSLILRFWDSRFLGVVLLLGTIVLLGYGLSQGQWNDFVLQWQTSRFIHVMSLDFGMLTLLFPTLVADDLARRGIYQKYPWWGLSLLPLVGACLYLIFRPKLPE